MFDFLRKLFFTSDFMPHGHCYFWRPEILWLHVVSDALIALAYFSIPVALFYFTRKRRSLAFDWIFLMFGVFICACGTTHLLEIVTVWQPMYRLAGLLKAITAFASTLTAVAIWKIVPRILAMPSPRKLQEHNQRLKREVATRQGVEEELRRSRDELEERVQLRTAELRAEVAAREQAEAGVRASQRQLQNILDYAPMPIFLKDRAGHYLQANRAFARVCGCKTEEVLGKTTGELFSTETTAEVDDHNQQVFATGQAQEFEEVIEQEDGPHVFLSTRFLLPGLDGSHDTLGVISRDVTERKHAERALEQARAEAERANLAKSEFLSRMSHELRTPLNAILGFGQLLELSQLAERDAQGVKHILKGGRHLLGLINEVLDLARVEAGHLSISPEPVCVGEMLNEALALIRPLATQRGIQLDGGDGSAPADSYVCADRQRLRQVLLNLLSNAVKYNRDNGQVVLSCLPNREGSRLRIEVADTGVGISAQNLPRLFVPFERLDADKGGVEGSGLGLALSKRLVESMGGSIGVESQPGQGSTFWVELPLTDRPMRRLAEAASPGDQMPPVPVSAEAKTVLYIEDNLSNLQLLERIFESRPRLRLCSAMQGSLGLELARRHRPDLILLDLHLPDLGGDTVLARLRAQPETAAVPVVMISADATPGQIERLLAAGAHAYLTKPFDVSELLHIVDGVATGSSRAAPSLRVPPSGGETNGSKDQREVVRAN